MLFNSFGYPGIKTPCLLSFPVTDEREDNVNSVVPPIDYLTGTETEPGWVARPLNEGRKSLAGLETPELGVRDCQYLL